MSMDRLQQAYDNMRATCVRQKQTIEEIKKRLNDTLAEIDMRLGLEGDADRLDCIDRLRLDSSELSTLRNLSAQKALSKRLEEIERQLEAEADYRCEQNEQ